jgi:hypothetical protein
MRRKNANQNVIVPLTPHVTAYLQSPARDQYRALQRLCGALVALRDAAEDVLSLPSRFRDRGERGAHGDARAWASARDEAAGLNWLVNQLCIPRIEGDLMGGIDGFLDDIAMEGASQAAAALAALHDRAEEPAQIGYEEDDQ